MHLGWPIYQESRHSINLNWWSSYLEDHRFHLYPSPAAIPEILKTLNTKIKRMTRRRSFRSNGSIREIRTVREAFLLSLNAQAVPLSYLSLKKTNFVAGRSHNIRARSKYIHDNKSMNESPWKKWRYIRSVRFVQSMKGNSPGQIAPNSQ